MSTTSLVYLALPIIGLELILMAYVFLLRPQALTNRFFAAYMLTLAISNSGGLIQGTAATYPAAQLGAWAQAAATWVAGPLLWLLVLAVYVPGLRRRRPVIALWFISILIPAILMAADLASGAGLIFDFPPAEYTGAYLPLRDLLDGRYGPLFYSFSITALSLGVMVLLLGFAFSSSIPWRLRRTARVLLVGLILAGGLAALLQRVSPVLTSMIGPLLTAIAVSITIIRYQVFSPVTAAMRVAVQAADFGLMVFDKDLAMLELNDKAVRLLDLDGHFSPGLSLARTFASVGQRVQDRPAFRSFLQEIADVPDQPSHTEIRLLGRDPTASTDLTYLNLNTRPIRNPYGERIGTLCAIEDVTAERQAQTRTEEAYRELWAAQDILRTLNETPRFEEALPLIWHRLASVTGCSWVGLAIQPNEHDGTFEGVLERPQAILGPLLPLPHSDSAVANNLARGERHLTPYLRREKDHPIEQALIKAGIQSRICLPLKLGKALVGALHLGWNQPYGYSKAQLPLLTQIAEALAITLQRNEVLETLERKVAERTQELVSANERLLDLDRLKSKFIADISHALRTPAANLNLYVRLLGQGNEEKRGHYLSVLDHQIELLTALLEDILAITSLDASISPSDFKTVNLNALARQVVEGHTRLADEAGLQLTFEPQPDLPPIQGNSARLTDAIVNLVTNAINYTEEGSVSVSTHFDPARRQVCLGVSDTGIGLEAEDEAHLFDRFYRGQRTSQSNKLGTGLGLSIVKEIVDRHGGQIEVDSELGAGSTFRLWFHPDVAREPQQVVKEVQ